MQNVINFKKDIVPLDLMSFKEVQQKYGIKYPTLYKYTRLLGIIPLYTNGGFKVSENDIQQWLKQGYVAARGS